MLSIWFLVGFMKFYVLTADENSYIDIDAI